MLGETAREDKVYIPPTTPQSLWSRRFMRLLLPWVDQPFETIKMTRRSLLSRKLSRGRRCLPILPDWKLRMISDMIASKELTISYMAEAAECTEGSIIEFMQFRQILLSSLEDDETMKSQSFPAPQINISTSHPDNSISVSICTSTVIDVDVACGTSIFISTSWCLEFAACHLGCTETDILNSERPFATMSLRSHPWSKKVGMHLWHMRETKIELSK